MCDHQRQHALDQIRSLLKEIKGFVYETHKIGEYLDQIEEDFNANSADENDSLRKEVAHLTKELEEEEDKNDTLTADLDAANDKISALQEEIAKCKIQVEDLEKQLQLHG
jgi:cell division septum initiation protein DivIVA